MARAASASSRLLAAALASNRAAAATASVGSTQPAASSRAYSVLANAGRCSAASVSTGGKALLGSVLAGCMLPSPGQQVLLPAAAMGGLVMTRWGRRGLFGSAVSKEEEPAAAAAADASPLDLDIGGEGGYFDHDERHEGLEARAEVALLFDTWNKALATKDPETVAALYGHDAVLLPTVSNEVRTTRAGIVDYFTNFLKLSPQGKIDQSTIRLLSPGVALHSGVYSFTLQPSPDETKMVQARFTFLYRKYNGRWMIAEHHSSAMPEAQPEGVAEMFDRWNAALQTGNPEIVADLYAADGVLLPTVSNQVRTCRQGIVDYFSNFLKLKPYGTINNSVIREVAPGVAINSGVYTFKLTRESGAVDDVTARYTFIYKKLSGKWFIAEHHSSAMPEPVA